MKFGVAFASRVGDHHLVRLAEDLGYHEAWFYDSQMIYSDVYATMALAADRTSRIRLGTGVAVPTTRLAPVIAHSIATIAQLAPGRVDLGIGTGNTARLSMGFQPITLTRLKREVRVIRALLRGETVDLAIDGETHPVKLLHPEGGFVDVSRTIPVVLSAMGPKIMEFCGAECDAHMSWGLSPAALEGCRAWIDRAAVAAGKPSGSVPSVLFVPTAVLAPGETSASPRILSLMESFVTNWLHVQCEWGERAPGADAETAELVEDYKRYVAALPAAERHLRLHTGHLVYAREDEKRFVTPLAAEKVGLVADADAIVERLHQYEAAGLDQYVFQVTSDPERQLRDFAEQVMARYR